MMADCSKTVEFSAELYRLCETDEDEYGEYGACSDTCPFNDGERNCPFDRQITQEDVDIVQKWSDEHPSPKPKTYLDKLLEAFPNVLTNDKVPAICRAYLFGDESKYLQCPFDYNHCEKCWNEVMPE